jgi:DNA-binding winged helix-turn-helix (wHTH) protein
MNQELTAVRALRFGAFELDPRARELRKGGLRLKLEGKPLQVLELLLERAGELVTRKELRKRLWPDSFVDFDRGINTAMNRLRKTLGDTPDNPRYIETRSRLGYRFVAAVGAADVTTLPALRPVPLDAADAIDPRPAGEPGVTGFRVTGSSGTVPVVATVNPGFEVGALRLQVQRPDGELAEFSLRFTTTEGALNLRLDFCAAASEEGRKLQEAKSSPTAPIFSPAGGGQ